MKPARSSIRLGETVVGRPPVLNAAEVAPLEVAPLLEGRRPTPRRSLGAGRQSRAAHRLKLRSRLRDVYVLRPHPWAVDVTRNAGPRDAPRKRLLGMQPIHSMRTFFNIP